MNRDSLQEKFQITTPPKNDEVAAHQWKWPFNGSENRAVKDAGFLHRNNTKGDGAEPMGVKFNQLPPGMEIDNQLRYTHRATPYILAGMSDVSGDTNMHSIEHGYTRKEMKATDDQYGGEHMDHFYGEATDELGNTGFVERNNYLDRE